MTIARGMQEWFTLVQRLGYRLYPAGKARLNASPEWMVASILWFVSRIPSFRDLISTGVNECRVLVDVLVATASRLNPPASVKNILVMRPSDGPSAIALAQLCLWKVELVFGADRSPGRATDDKSAGVYRSGFQLA